MYICTLLSFYSINNSHRSNLKRIKDLLLSDTIEDDHVDDEDSGSDNDSDFVPVESDDTSTNEHISEESDKSIYLDFHSVMKLV
jgi:hypothetical protein